ncbi:unnamed protein product [Diamesa hyperborea]
MQLHIKCIYVLLFIKIHLNTYGAEMDKTHSQNKLSQGKKSPHTDSNNINQNFSVNPYFDFTVARNLTTRVGQTAFLHCRVEQLGDKSVSWIRKRDLHILSAGTSTYTSDERFQVIEHEQTENWTLQIKFAQQRDSGIYECQVNTEPKMSLAFRLNVVEAKATILGQSDLYVKMGSIVVLTCVISQGPHDLGTIMWYRGSNLINQTHPNDSTSIYPMRVSVDVKWTEALTSRLKILSARFSDSGNYSCVPTIGESSNVMVHIINGEHPAAMQKSRVKELYNSKEIYLLILLSLFVKKIIFDAKYNFIV